jgi:hypothetical protein
MKTVEVARTRCGLDENMGLMPDVDRELTHCLPILLPPVPSRR